MAMNHKHNTLNFKFKVSEDDDAITVFRDYAMIITFPQAISNTSACSVTSGSTSLAVTVENDNANNTIKCIFAGTALEGVKLSSYVNIALSGLTLANNFYKGVKVSLATAKANGVLLASNPSLNSYAQYDDYLTNSSPYVKVTSSKIVNGAPPSIVTCAAPCSNLYPYNSFTLTVDIEVTKYVKIEEFLLMFSFSGNGLETNKVPTITSTDSETSTTNPLLKKLDGTLTLKKFGSYFVVDGILPTIDLDTKNSTPNFNIGRKFKLTFSGFTTNAVNVKTSALTSMKTIVRWKNAASILSYQTYDLSTITIVKILPITTAAENQTDIKTSVELLEGNSYENNVIFQDGMWRFLYQMTIPAMPIKGTLKVTSKNDGETAFRFVTATCEHTNTDLNTFGTRKLCVPKSAELSANTVDSTFEISLEESSSNQIVSFNIWGQAVKCGDEFTNLSNALKFVYEYTLSKTSNKVAEATSFSSQIKCQSSTIPFADFYTQTTDTAVAIAAAKVYDHDNKGTMEYKDLVLYSEFNSFDFVYVSDFTTPITQNQISNAANLKFLSEFGSSTTNAEFVLRQPITQANLVKDFLLLQTRKWSTADDNVVTGVNIYQKGNAEFILDSKYTTYATGDCTFNTSLENTGNTTLKIYSFNNKSTTAANQKLVTTNTYRIKTPNLNDSTITGSNYFDASSMSAHENVAYHVSCYKMKDYNGINVTSLYQSMNFFFAFKRIGGALNTYNRIARFYKFFNGGAVGFRKASEEDIADGNFAKIWNGTGSAIDNNKLCILEINKTVFSKFAESVNTLYITLQNSEQLNVGYEGSDIYPTANVSSATAYPLYSDRFTTDGNNIENLYKNMPASILSNQIVVSGITKSVDKHLYLPMICLTNFAAGAGYIGLQAVQPSGSKFINTNNQVFTHNGGAKNKLGALIFFMNSAPNAVDGSNVQPQFLPYNDVSDNDVNILTNNKTSHAKAIALLLFTESLTEVSSDKTIFAQTNILTGNNASTFKINTVTYSKMYIQLPSSDGSTYLIDTTSTINLVTRPTMATKSANYKFKIHGVGKNSETTPQNFYFTNEEPLVKGPTATNDTDLKVALTAFNNKAIYTNDSGANFQIKVDVKSKLTLTGGSLTLASTSFNSNSICVQDNKLTYQVKTAGEMVFTELNVTGSTAGTWTTFNFTCFNMKTSATGKVTMTTATSFTVSGWFTSTLKEAVSTAVGTVAVDAADQIVPKVIKVTNTQSNSRGGLGCTFLNIDLGRSYRVGQTIVLKSALSGYYKTEASGTKMPNCRYSMSSSFNNLEQFQFTNNLSNAAFVDTCEFAGSAASHTITIKTNHHVPKLEKFSQNVVIQLCPIQVVALDAVTYEITTYLRDDTATTGKISSIALTGDKILSFPKANPALPASTYGTTIPAIAKLCNLTDVFPRVASVVAQYTWQFVISEANKTFLDDTVNKDSGKKCFNEFSIYVDPRNYERNGNIWCMHENAYVPCEFTVQNYINVRVGKCLGVGNYSIVVIGLVNPYWTFTTSEVTAGGTENSKFDCSVNFFESDSRESLLVGKGNNAISSYSTPTGSFVYYTPKTLVSNTRPDEIGNYELLFMFDYTQGLTAIPTTFAPTDGKSVMLVKFPFTQYDFLNYSGKPTATLTLFKSKVNSVAVGDNTYEQTVHEEVLDTFKDIVVTRTNNWVRIELPKNIEFPEEMVYFKLVLNGLPTANGQFNSNQIQVSLMDDDKVPTKYYNSFENLSTNIGLPVADTVYNWYHGPSFTYAGDSKAYIAFDNYVTLYPGRYTNVNLTLKGNKYSNVDTKVSLDSRAGFGALKNGVDINSGLKTTNVIAIGVACGTSYGSYWLGMTLSNTTNIYNLHKLRANVTQLKKNVASISIVSYTSSNNASSFDLPPGGIINLKYVLSFAPFEDIPLTYGAVTGTTNSVNFEQVTGSAKKIAKQTLGSTFGYQYKSTVKPEEAAKLQKISITSGNKCFGFGSTASESVNVTFTITGELAKLTGNFAQTDFKYIEPTTNASLNQMTVTFIKPELQTSCVFTLICSAANDLSQEQAFDISVPIANSSIVSIVRKEITSTDPYSIVFNNLARGNSWKFMAYCRSMGITPTYKNLVSSQASLLKDTADTKSAVSLATTKLAPNTIVQMKFTEKQSDALVNRVLLKYQQGVDAEYGAGVVTVSNNTKDSATTLKGYPAVVDVKCAANSATMNFPTKSDTTKTDTTKTDTTKTDTTKTDTTKTDTTKTDTTNTNTNTNGLRYLADTTTTTKTTTTPTTTKTDTTTTTTTTTPTVNYDNNIWMILKQDVTSTKTIDFTKYTDQLKKDINTKANLQAWLGSGVTVTGDYQLNTTVDDKVSLSGVSIVKNTLIFDKTAQTISFVALNSTGNMFCYYKINVSPTADKPAINKENVENCPAKTKGCGSITLVPNNTVKTVINVSPMIEGWYRVQFVCPSEVPGSAEFNTFQTEKAMEYKKDEVVDKTCTTGETFSETTQKCEKNTDNTNPIKATYINVVFSLIALFSLFLFDF